MAPLIHLLPLGILILFACSITPHQRTSKNHNSPQWHQHQQEVCRLSRYQTHGVFAYLSDRKKISAHFFWQQIDQDNYRFLLLNPIGKTELEINIQSNQVEISYDTEKHCTATDAEEMINKLIGMSIPFNSLRQWIIGLPGDATDYNLNEQHRISELNYNQNGKTWKVVYNSYDTKNTPVLPSSMELTEDGQCIKLDKMDNWIIK